ncbi:hypothetical protein PoMZ_09544 [Pyricularia oryzae]|uniref:Amino acid transporter transmembrane domain-containing protein n=1 Tax=Pyricularia oryzae TaxID=318829 RepID=A0A4P7N1W5_PYROR|nr:hypothetical protein PoMZ_09544 [Pyricularia oryzae]
MSHTGRESPSQMPPLGSSPVGSFRGRSLSTSVPRADVTARLASPLPSQFGSPSAALLASSSPRPHAYRQASESGSLTPLAGASATAPGPGISALAAALSNTIGTSPPRFGTPPVRSQSPAASSAAAPMLGSPPPANYGSFDARARLLQSDSSQRDDDEAVAEIVRRHLVQPTDSSEGPDDSSKGKQVVDGSGPGLDDDEFSSLKLQGGDITRPIYRWTEDATNRERIQRSKSFSMPRPDPEHEVLDINNIKVPGGFRRNFLRRAARSPSANPSSMEGGRTSQEPPLVTSNFLEFLSIYGHFAGEELEEDDEVLGPGEYFSSGDDDEDLYTAGEGSDDDRDPMEDSALLTPGRRKRRRKHRGGSGKATPLNAAMVLLKSFVGTGVLFLPRAYLNGGMIFSNLVLLFVAALSYYCFVLLVNTRLKVDGSFGDIGGILYGKWMRLLILTSIVISQVGFVAAYIVFTSENLKAFILAVTDCRTSIDVGYLILMQMVIFLPFSLFRDINKLAFTALIADAFIVIGLAYLFYFDVLTLSTNGLADIIYFNQKDWTLFIGTAIFTFEGIGLIIPIQESMKDPKKFPKVMAVIMVIITTLFTVMGAVSYAAYGSKTETVVLLNLPQDDKMVNVVQFLYSLAILLSTPLQIFPAIRITENGLFTRSGKYNPYIKWQKNIYRFCVVAGCAALAWGGADNLDKFVALVGNFACIPLVYIYPPLLHYRAVAKSNLKRWSDLGLCVFGFVAMAYTTSLTVMAWADSSSEPKPPSYCDSKRH